MRILEYRRKKKRKRKHMTVFPNSSIRSERCDSIYCVKSARMKIIILNYYIFYSVASTIFLVIFSATVYQEVKIVFALTRWMETVIYSHMFYAILQFCA